MSNKSFLSFSSDDFALSTDLYELTMAAAYFDQHVDQRAVFELFVRDMPRNRGYLVFAGLEQIVEYFQALHFTGEDIDFIRSLPPFSHVSSKFFEYLREFQFSCDVDAMHEGTIFFPAEPVLRVEGPVIEAQIVESFVLSVVNFESLIATKTARIVSAAKGKGVVEFGLRRAHSPMAGLLGARASIVGGCESTSNVLTAKRAGVKTVGTMAHSWVMNFPSEKESFLAFYKVFPDSTIFLVDTYDVKHAVQTVVEMGLPQFQGVRLDSGNLEKLSVEVRRILDKAKCKQAMIFATGDLNEYIIEQLVHDKAPIDAFGVGTELITSRDDPALGGIYKLVAIKKEGVYHYKLKLSTLKRTLPGLKQVYRMKDGTHYSEDFLVEINEKPPKGG
ncbi:MAG TPA: nicotinate phosphoribosyltransferase, partial [Bdellovibrionota bacterium]|nr:nicotinate phosphoribosyltransferase [Bdellovibrionota bacterium]